MAMATYMQMVNAEQLAQLRAHPESVNQLDEPDCLTTYLSCSISYFLTGEASPSRDGPLAALFGAESVECQRLECGSFEVVSPEEVARLARALAEVDVDEVMAAVGRADLGALVDEEELDELEVFAPDEVAEQIGGDTGALGDFYLDATNRGLGLVIYTT